MRFRWLLCCLPVLLLAAAPLRLPPDEDILVAEQTLREAGVGLDGRSLLQFFRARSLSAGETERLARLTRDLGDDSFDVRQRASRQLIAAGRPAISVLHAAERDPDLEVVRRAERCLRAVEHGAEQEMAAAFLLGLRRTPGSTETLVAFLPQVVDDAPVWAALMEALDQLGPQPALVTASSDKEPSRRAAAGFILGQVPAHRTLVRKLLQDPVPLVRLEAARGLLMSGDREAVPALASLTGAKDPDLVYRAEDLLYHLLGDTVGPALPSGSNEDARSKRQRAWESWWMERGQHIDVTRRKWHDTYQNLTIVCDCSVGGVNKVGRIWVCGRDGKVRWEVNGVANPADVQLLPGGGLLIAECYGGNIVTERDRMGRVLWQYMLSDEAVNCQRLPGGNTFIATYTQILEVTPAGKVVYSHKLPYRTTCALKLRNGNILYAASEGKLAEVTTDFKEVRSVKMDNLASWAGIEVLPGGRLLVARYSANSVVEIDATGRVLWSLAVDSPAYASRLRNGNTLVCSPNGQFVAEYNRHGKEVWRRAAFGRPFRVRRF
jgi:hypothetical protein